MATTQTGPSGGFRALWRFLPMLWPKGETELKARVIAALLLVLAGKAAVLLMPFAYKAVIDGMSGRTATFGVVAGLVAGYATARFAGVLSDNLRNALFEKVGQKAARRLATTVFRHVHDLSLRFHLERRTGSLTKIVERGTKSIDMMLYFLLFNIAPTVVELGAICIIFLVKFGAGLVAATLVIVTIYITFTRLVTDWRAHLPCERDIDGDDHQRRGDQPGTELDEEDHADRGQLDHRWRDVEQQEIEHHVDALGPALDDFGQRAGAALEVEAQRQVVDVAEHLAGKPPRGVLPDLLEDRIAEVVEQHTAEARAGVGDHQARNDREGRMSAHPVDRELQRIGPEQGDGLAAKDEQDGDNHARLELGLPFRPQHRQEAPQRGEAGVRFLLPRLHRGHDAYVGTLVNPGKLFAS